MPNGLPKKELTPEEKIQSEIIKEPDYQQITIQEYSVETKDTPEKILNLTRHIHQSVSLGKRVDTVRQWVAIYKDEKVVGYNNQGSILEIKTELFGVK